MIKNDDLYHYRAMEMLKHKLAGSTYQAIAAQYGVSVDTVSRSIDYLGRSGTLAVLENKIIEELVPKAVQIYSQQLDKGNVDVAKDVIKNLVLIGNRDSKRKEHVEKLGLKAYLESKKDRLKSEDIIDVQTDVTPDDPPANRLGLKGSTVQPHTSTPVDQSPLKSIVPESEQT
jgi:hypothetical protein